MSWIKKQWVKFKKWIIVFCVGGLALSGTLLLNDPIVIPESFIIDGSSLLINYTDNNDNEDLIIQAEAERYPNFFGNIKIKFSIINISKQNQNIKIAFAIKDAGETKYVKYIKESVGEEIVNTLIPPYVAPKYAEELPNVLKNTATTTIQENRTIWKKLVLTDFSNHQVVRKDVKGAKTKKEGLVYILKGQTKVFFAELKYTDFEGEEEFFIEAFGDKGSYGHLDPWSFEDKFNSDTKSTGDLNGQDGWAGNASYDVVASSTTLEGNQMIENLGGVNVDVDINGLSDTSGIVYHAIMCNTFGISGSRTSYVWLDASNKAAWVWTCQNNGGTKEIRIWTGAGQTAVASPASENVWYLVAVDWQKDHGGAGVHELRYKWKIKGGTYSAFSSFEADLENTDGTIERLIFNMATDGGGTWNAWWDSITPTDPDPDAPVVVDVPQTQEVIGSYFQ